MKSAVTISLVAETRGGPFVFFDGLVSGIEKADGFDGVEIFPPSAESVNARELKVLLEQHGLKLAAMGTGAGWVREKLRLTDPDPTVRRRAQDFIGAIVDLAGSFGAPAIIGSMQGRWGDGSSREQALEWIGAALEQLGPRAHALGVPVLLEPLNRYETNLFTRVADTVQFLQSLRTQNIKLLCDLFHMNIEEADIARSIREAGDKLGHVHFADNNRQAIGFGHTNIPPVIQALRAIGYEGYLSAEVLPLPDSASAAAQTLKSFRLFTGAQS